MVTHEDLRRAYALGKANRNMPAAHLVAAIDNMVQNEDFDSLEDALAHVDLDYGCNGETGGLNVCDHHADYTFSKDSIWQCIRALIEQALSDDPNGIPAWWWMVEETTRDAQEEQEKLEAERAMLPPVW